MGLLEALHHSNRKEIISDHGAAISAHDACIFHKRAFNFAGPSSGIVG